MNVELHITSNALTNNELGLFEEFCHSIKAKPIIIELSKGENKQQPMISKVIACLNKESLKKEVATLVNNFKSNGYEVKRIKMEVAPWDKINAEKIFGKNSSNYFEWHGKIRIEIEK